MARKSQADEISGLTEAVLGDKEPLSYLSTIQLGSFNMPPSIHPVMQDNQDS